MIMQGWATNRRPWGELNALERKTNRLASGVAAREGEDPRAGLQRSRQPGPTGATPDFSLEEPANTQIMGAMRNDYEHHILRGESCKMMQAPELGIPAAS
jgi:hypothetical protein